MQYFIKLALLIYCNVNLTIGLTLGQEERSHFIVLTVTPSDSKTPAFFLPACVLSFRGKEYLFASALAEMERDKPKVQLIDFDNEKVLADLTDCFDFKAKFISNSQVVIYTANTKLKTQIESHVIPPIVLSDLTSARDLGTDSLGIEYLELGTIYKDGIGATQITSVFAQASKLPTSLHDSHKAANDENFYVLDGGSSDGRSEGISFSFGSPCFSKTKKGERFCVGVIGHSLKDNHSKMTPVFIQSLLLNDWMSKQAAKNLESSRSVPSEVPTPK